MKTTFTKLNTNWNAEPNAPYPEVKIQGSTLKLYFTLNSFEFSDFADDQKGKIEFTGVRRYRLGRTNDEGWYRGQCRFSGIAPSWGEFYLVEGNKRMEESPKDWEDVDTNSEPSNHYLFYLRDQTFECEATSWKFEPLTVDPDATGQRR
jgi:hypothetical protein